VFQLDYIICSLNIIEADICENKAYKK